MARRLRKSRRMRGSRTQGWGRSGQHRASGQLGGHGHAGSFKHKWTYAVKYESRRGKFGFKSPTSRGELRTINVGELDQLADRLQTEEKAKEEEGKIVVDLTQLGYDKLLGVGDAAKPFLIKVKEYSKSAAEKVEEAGGKILSDKGD